MQVRETRQSFGKYIPPKWKMTPVEKRAFALAEPTLKKLGEDADIEFYKTKIKSLFSTRGKKPVYNTETVYEIKVSELDSKLTIGGKLKKFLELPPTEIGSLKIEKECPAVLLSNKILSKVHLSKSLFELNKEVERRMNSFLAL